MNSIEALNELIDEIKYTHNDGKTLTEYDAKLVEIIKKDLEALVVLKKYFRIKIHDKNIFDRTWMIEVDYDLLKVWLNENN